MLLLAFEKILTFFVQLRQFELSDAIFLKQLLIKKDEILLTSVNLNGMAR